MKKRKINITAFVLVICMLLSTNVVALGLEKQNNGLLKYEDVDSYIRSAVTINSDVILEQPVTYYHGENYTVIEEIYGYSLIVEDENGIYANGKLVAENFKLSKELDLTKNALSKSNWSYVNTNNIPLSLGGLTVAAAAVIIGRKMPDIPRTIIDDFILAASGYVVGSILPDVWVANFKTDTYIRIEDPFIGLVSYKYDKTFTTGPQGNESMFEKSWITYNYNTVI